MPHDDLIDRYAAGSQHLQQTIQRMSNRQLDAAPIAGLWSSRYVVCHIADFEIVYADRMKRVIAEHEPPFFGADPDTFAASLAYGQREAEVEVQIIELVRRQMTSILRTLSEADFARIGQHNEAGPLSLATLLESVTTHLVHHTQLIADKRRAIAASDSP